MDSIIAQALAATTVVKVLVDALKLGVPRIPRWGPVALALAGGPVVVGLLMVAAGDTLTQQLIAQAIIAGILAGGGAAGVTEISNRAQFPKSKNWGG